MLAVPNAHVDASVASDKRTPSSFFVESPSDLYNTTYPIKAPTSSIVGGKRSRSPSQALRSRSNSFNSAAGSSSGSSGGASFSSVSSQEWTCLTESDVDSPAASQASDEDHARSCPSPSEGKRKAVRCLRGETACDAIRKDSEDVGSLDGAVRAFRLGSRDPSPAESQSSSCSLSTASTDSDRVKDVGIKGALVDHLVDVSVLTIDAIWHSPLPVAEQPTYASCSASSLSLPLFIRETLRRSRTSCSTLQAALLYCIRAAPAVRKARLQFAALQNSHGVSAAQALMIGTPAYQLLCGRRNFLAAVMVAAKFLQDRTFSNRAWSKITGLPLRELGYVEREFLAAIGWDLNVRSDEWEGWTRKLAGANGGASAQQAQAQAQAQAQQQATQPAAVSAPALPASVLQLRAASRPSTASSSTSSSSSSSSCVTPVPTPTATPATTTVSAAAPPRSALARTHSDAAPFKAFDVSLSPSGVKAEDGAAAAPARTVGAEATAALVKSTAIAHPFPMPRVFARSTGSFTFGAGQVGLQQQQQQQQQQ